MNRPRRPRSLRPWILTAALSVVCGVGLVRWAESSEGRILLADQGVPAADRWLRDELQDRVLDSLTRAGVAPDSLTVTSPDRRGRVTVRATTAASFLPINLAVTESVESLGGRVHRGVLHRSKWGQALELEVGSPRRATHRVLVLRGPAPVEPPPAPLGRLAIVIDDWGYNLSATARRILHLPAPLTVAILPDLRFSRRVLTEATRAGKRALLHLPMEPEGPPEMDSGAQLISVGMPSSEIRELTSRYLDGLDGVCGVNNHMGSRATRHRAEMASVMEVVASRGLLFLDSVTTPRSVAHRVAVEFGVPAARNDAFLDADTVDPVVVEARLWKLVEKARKRGHAIGISHVNEATARALERVVQALDPADVQLVALDELIYSLPP